ncbi:reverse transcriptase domain-containing protein [Tanacetum coccineum]
MTNLTDLLTKIMNTNTASTSGSGSLPSNTVANPKSDLKAITTRCGISYNGTQVPPPPSSFPKVVECETEVTKDTVLPTNNESTEDVQPPVVLVETQNSKLVVAPVSALKPNPKPSIPYSSRLNDQKIREKANNQIEKFGQIFQDFHFDISFADALILMPKFASTLKSLISNKEKFLGRSRCKHQPNASLRMGKANLPDLTKTRMILELADRTISTPTGIAEDVFMKVGTFFFPADFVVVDYVADPRVPLILGRPFLRMARDLIDVHGEEITLHHDDQSVTFKVGNTSTFSYNNTESVNHVDVIDVACEEYVQEVLEISKSGNPTSPFDLMIDSCFPSFTPFGGSDFLMEEIDAFLKQDDSIPPGIDDIYDSEGDTLYLEELLNPPDLELKDLPSHLEYAFLEGDDKLPVIIAKNLKDEDKAALIKSIYVKEGIVLGHKISTNGIEVDKPKVDVIAKLPHPTTVKGIRSFLGQIGIASDFEASRAHGFVLCSLELHILSFVLGIQYPNLID